jgi:hypothetical protein
MDRPTGSRSPAYGSFLTAVDAALEAMLQRRSIFCSDSTGSDLGNQGLFYALYSDRGSHFFLSRPRRAEKVDKRRLTQVGRAMKELGVQMIPGMSRFAVYQHFQFAVYSEACHLETEIKLGSADCGIKNLRVGPAFVS